MMIELFDSAIDELGRMGSQRQAQWRVCCCSEKAYPVIETGYQANIDIIKDTLITLENLLPIGCSGTVQVQQSGSRDRDRPSPAARTALGVDESILWQVNIDGIYHERRGARSVKGDSLHQKSVLLTIG